MAAWVTIKEVARDVNGDRQGAGNNFGQYIGESRAEGGVRSTDFSAKGSGAQLAAVPANISADAMQANSKTGRALYTGPARLWQGRSVEDGDSNEPVREPPGANSNGNARPAVPQAPGPTPPQHQGASAPPAQ